jgi:hypothetical protein
VEGSKLVASIAAVMMLDEERSGELSCLEMVSFDEGSRSVSSRSLRRKKKKKRE